MKKAKSILALVLAVVLALSTGVFAIAAENEPAETMVIKLQIDNSVMTVNGTEQAIDENGTVPIIQDSRTLLPVRAVVEAMGGTVEWDGVTETATLIQANTTIKLTIGSTTAYLNDTPQTLDVTPVIINDRTMLPIRFVAEGFGFSVTWNRPKQTVNIIKSTIQSPVFNLENKTVTLNNGVEMPVLGLGTYRLSAEETENSVVAALNSGYSLIDTAAAYRNEEAVGRGIKKSGVAREDIFLVTKLWPADYADAAKAIDTALEKLDVEYIDLLFLHQPWQDYVSAYKAMEDAVAAGKVRAIGVSNFYQSSFDEIMEIATIPPAVLQNERNPYFQQAEMMEYIAPYGTVMMDWFPLGGRGNNEVPTERQKSLFEDEVILEIAEAHGKSAVQIILRWHIQSGGIAIPGSRNPDHILENITIFDFELTDEEMQKIATLETDIPAFDFREVTEQPDFETFVPPSGSND